MPSQCFSVLESIGFDTEIFASPFNNFFKNYCSIFFTDMAFRS